MHSYLKYLEQVLGARQILVDRGHMVVDSNPPPTPENPGFEVPAFFYSEEGPLKAGQSFAKTSFVVLNFVEAPEDSLFNEDVKELYTKMVAALKLPAQQVLSLDCVMNEKSLVPAELQKVVESKCVLFFSRHPADLGKLFSFGEAFWVETYSPRILLEAPELKKQVWNDMQMLLKQMSKF